MDSLQNCLLDRDGLPRESIERAFILKTTMSIQESLDENTATPPKGGELGSAKLRLGTVSEERAKTKEQTATSEYRKLENYILGSSAAVITNASLIVGLGTAHAGKGPILGGLLTVAIADNISDSLGIHLYKESEGRGRRLSSIATVLNFFSRLLVSLSFIAIVLVFPTSQAIIIAIIWALLLLNLITYLIGRSNHETSVFETIKHASIAIGVIALSWGVGRLISDYFK